MSASPAMVVPKDGEKQLTGWSTSSLCENIPSSNLDKETSRLGNDITTKVRKPYTITKQRERWTEEEHGSFLEALKLHGRAWRQIEEHVGTKTAVQIRSHAQKFFSKLEREGSSGFSKGPISEISIPPPRPKRKPAHPYPRKGLALNSHSTRTQSRLPQISGSQSSGCEIGNDAVMEANKSPATNTPQMSDRYPLNTLSDKAFSGGLCQQPRKRGTEEVQCEAFPNKSQETAKLSKSTCAKPELISSPNGAATPQPADSLMPYTNILPFEMYRPQMPLPPYYHPMHSLAAFLNPFSKSSCELGKLDDVPNLASFIAAHAQLGNSLMPWLNQIPIAIAAAAATTPWNSLVPPSPPLPPPHLPLRPPSDRLKAESPSTVVAAITAAAAASFTDASTWLAFHRAFTHPPNAPEVRSLFKPNPVVHSALAEGQQQQDLANSSEGSKNGVTISGQTSSEEHDATTADGMQETSPHTNQPNPFADNNSVPSSEHIQSNFSLCEEEALKKQENRVHSSTNNSCNVKKDKRRGFPGNGTMVESTNGLQNSAYLTVNGKTLGRLSTNIDGDQLKFSRRMYQGSNSPKANEGKGEGYAYTDCTLEEQSGSSLGKSKDCMALESITNTADMEIQVKIDMSMQHETGWSYKRQEYTPGEDSKARQCMSSCGSTEDKKEKVNKAPHLSSKSKDKEIQECGQGYYTDDSGSEIVPCEKAGKLLVQACLKRWLSGKLMLTRTCTNPKSMADAVRGNSSCRAQAKDRDAEHRESMAKGLVNGNKKGLPLIQAQSLNGSKASSSGSSKYSGHGFVPYRRG